MRLQQKESKKIADELAALTLVKNPASKYPKTDSKSAAHVRSSKVFRRDCSISSMEKTVAGHHGGKVMWRKCSSCS